ncbi:outer membrane protein/peptidoglycan-associated lipoprotein [Bradyrhizobium sp. YR681]|uniref:OmpA family protein n=1 Tax=Bradyrhizobium sp. YR681 TaxID=1144344 RepID=UPI0002711B3D|nr:OmpA family protein [Bradyrhizobium sp. YR681]EJN16050.1 outer membrane protein/peptidoglycan-associated lipoprotein [Bradyrhizobium sp. YR681]
MKNGLISLALAIPVIGCSVDPYTREQKVSESVQQGSLAAAKCGGLSFVGNVLSGRSGGDSLVEAGKAATVCGVAGAIAGAQLDAYEQQLLADLQAAGVKMTIRQDARVLEVEEPIAFPRNVARLTAQSAGTIAAIGTVLQKYSERRVDIIGHTASDEDQSLGIARAKTVARRLHQMTGGQVPLQSIGKGASEPVGDNATETGRDRNRRVAVFVALHAAE